MGQAPREAMKLKPFVPLRAKKNTRSSFPKHLVCSIKKNIKKI